MFSRNSFRVAATLVACAFTLNLASHAEVSAGSKSTRTLITQKIDNKNLVTLEHNTSRLQKISSDLGPVEDSFKFNHMFLVMKRTPEQELALKNFLDRQQQKGAPEYHQWLTPAQFGETFGASQTDLAKVSAWLESQGFKVNNVPHSGMLIDFAGDARTIREAFHTQLHYYMVNGLKRVANVSDPKIPVALQPAVAGIQGLKNFKATPEHTKPGTVTFDATTHQPIPDESTPSPNYYVSSTSNYVGPQDFYTIYNENGLLNATTPVTGSGATVAVVEESDIEYGTVNSSTGAATGGDLNTFRSAFGVPGTLNMYVFHGFGADTCSDPGIDPSDEEEDVEASLDAEWANAVAPNAKLIFMSCDDTTDNGIFTSMQALLDQNLADTMSLSYGESELYLESSDFAFLDAMYEQGAAQGQSIVISTGDSGSDSKDDGYNNGTDYLNAVSGLNVSGFSSSPLVTGAGGTDFQDYYDQLESDTVSKISTYWNTTNTTYFGSAKSYIPETPWNSSCAGSLIANYEGYSGTNEAGFCGTGSDADPSTQYSYIVGGSGGFSTHYSVPAYQSAVTGYSGTMRAEPDASLYASNGWWGHVLLFCDSHYTSYTCAETTKSGKTTIKVGEAGGTSFVAPQINGVAGLLRGYTGGRQGVLNYALYALAQQQFTASATKTACYSTGNATSNTAVTTALPASTCIFNDVTTGNNSVPCQSGSTNCYTNSGKTIGVLSTTTATVTPGYMSGIGYDETTGLGSFNITNLVNNWKKAFSTTTTLTAVPTSINTTQSTTLTASVAASVANGTTFNGVSGTITFYNGMTSLGTCTLSSATCSIMVSATTLGGAGMYSITASYGGNNNYPASVSAIVTVTVTSAPANGYITFTSVSHNFGQVAVGTAATAYTLKVTNTGTAAYPFSLAFTPSHGFTSATNCPSSISAGANCELAFYFTPTATGAVSATWSLTPETGFGYTPSNGGTLSGSGTSQGGVSITTAGHNFGTVAVGTTSATYGVELSNSTTSAVTINKGSVTAPFSVVTNCGSTVAAGSSCELEFTFSPTTNSTVQQVYSLSANGVTITSGGAALPNGGITLTGN